MNRLSITLIFFTGPAITALFLLPLFAFDWVGWGAVGIAAVAGFLLSWPSAYTLSRLIKNRRPVLSNTNVDPKPVAKSKPRTS